MRVVNFTFSYKTVLFLALGLFWLAAETAFAQTDTIYQKPSLNNGMPPSTPAPPPVIVAPAPPPVITETEKERKVREKEEKQDAKDKVPLKDRLFTGGGVGLEFSNSQTYIQLAPILGYKLTDWLGAGAGLTYTYYRITDRIGREYNFNIVGGKFFTQAMVYNNFFGHAEFEFIPYDGQTFTSFVFGPGYRQMISDKVGFDLMFLINGSRNANSIYENSFFRGGLYINL